MSLVGSLRPALPRPCFERGGAASTSGVVTAVATPGQLIGTSRAEEAGSKPGGEEEEASPLRSSQRAMGRRGPKRPRSLRPLPLALPATRCPFGSIIVTACSSLARRQGGGERSRRRRCLPRAPAASSSEPSSPSSSPSAPRSTATSRYLSPSSSRRSPSSPSPSPPPSSNSPCSPHRSVRSVAPRPCHCCEQSPPSASGAARFLPARLRRALARAAGGLAPERHPSALQRRTRDSGGWAQLEGVLCPRLRRGRSCGRGRRACAATRQLEPVGGASVSGRGGLRLRRRGARRRVRPASGRAQTAAREWTAQTRRWRAASHSISIVTARWARTMSPASTADARAWSCSDWAP